MQSFVASPPFMHTLSRLSIRTFRRTLIAAFCVIAALSVAAEAAETVTVTEYYNKDLDSYFITGRADEQQTLDSVSSFNRTGAVFVALPANAATSRQTRICRFYISMLNPPTSSHFYGRESVDCLPLIASPPGGFSYEGYDFAVAEASSAGLCPADARFPVYRAFRPGAGGKSPNHRYLVSLDQYNAMIARGWIGEGVAFCATAIKDMGDNTTRATLVRQAAETDPRCTAISPFYYEIGDKAGSLTSGSPGARYSATTVVPIASSSKWLYGAYVTEMRQGAVSADDVRFLTFSSGYVTFNNCAQTDTVGSCAVSGDNGRYTALAANKFYYSGAHMQTHATQFMGIGGLDNDGLANEIKRGLGLTVLSSSDFRYTQPQLAGGVATSPTVYASFLRKLLNSQLIEARQLNASPVCTNPLTCAAALYSPFPSSESPNYSIGHWVEDTLVSDGSYSSAGAFGFYPWIDATKTLYGIISRVDAAGSGAESVACGRVLRHTWATAKAPQ